MPQINVLGWNLENFGVSKYRATNGGQELIALVAKVIAQLGIHIAGFCEIRSKLAATIGADLVLKLNAAIAGSTWVAKPSDAFGKGRWEEYLFVYDSVKVKPYGTLFQHVFPNPTPPPVNLGFPRGSATDRPPFLGYFETQDAQKKKILVAILHSPSPRPIKFPRDAARNIAKVANITTHGDACIVMGDFNVGVSSDVNVAGSPGEAAFQDLVNAQFEQLLVGDVQSSLIAKKQAWVGMLYDDCRSSPYDQIFLRKRVGGGVTGHEPGIDSLIENCSTVPSNPPAAADTYLMPLLAAIDDVNNSVTPAGSTTYGAVEDAFVAFRTYVSDHYPVVVELKY